MKGHLAPRMRGAGEPDTHRQRAAEEWRQWVTMRTLHSKGPSKQHQCSKGLTRTWEGSIQWLVPRGKHIVSAHLCPWSLPASTGPFGTSLIPETTSPPAGDYESVRLKAVLKLLALDSQPPTPPSPFQGVPGAGTCILLSFPPTYLSCTVISKA